MSLRRAVFRRIKILAIVLLTATVILGVLSMASMVELPDRGILASGEVSVDEGALYLDRMGTPTTVGEVDNDQRQAISNVTVMVRFYDDDELLGTVNVTPASATIPARTTVPFAARYDGDGEPTHVEASVSSSASSGIGEDLAVEEHDIAREAADSVTIDGVIENEGNDPASPLVIVSFYDETGTILGYRTGRTSPDPIAGGERGEFRVQYVTLGDVPSLARDFADYEVVVVDREMAQ